MYIYTTHVCLYVYIYIYIKIHLALVTDNQQDTTPEPVAASTQVHCDIPGRTAGGFQVVGQPKARKLSLSKNTYYIYIYTYIGNVYWFVYIYVIYIYIDVYVFESRWIDNGVYPLGYVKIAIENGHWCWVFPLKMVIFHSCGSLPEGNGNIMGTWWERTTVDAGELRVTRW